MSTLSTAKMKAGQYLMMGEDPPGVRLELVEGEIVVSPSPTPHHSKVILNLVEALRPHIRDEGLGQLLADVDTVFSEDTVRRPDLLFVEKRREGIIQDVVSDAPDLCIEVISPSTATMDRVDKLKLYAQSGVKHYWIVDPHAKMVEGFALKAGKYVLSVMGRGDEVVKLPPFGTLAIKLKKIWA